MSKKIILLQILIFALIIAFCVSPLQDSTNTTTDFGLYTYDRHFLIDGIDYNILQSGESDFQYYHDTNGFVLLKESNGIYYATLDNAGRVISSGVDIIKSSNLKIAAVNKITRYQIDTVKNSEFVLEYINNDTSGILENLKNSEDNTSTISTDKIEIKNLVIFICFAGETSLKNDLIASADTIVASRLNSSANSMKDYYSDISYGYVNVDSLLPNSGGTVSAIYQDGYQRSYYAVSDSYTRTNREARLLTAAVNSIKSKFTDFSDYDLDLDDDGNIDSVSFIVSGADNNVHGGLLWPHAWNLEVITQSVGIQSPQINGMDVAKYTFNFVSDFNYGVVCHEFGHVLGAPDLYHNTSDFVPVGNWDLMATNNKVPQYPLVYTRDKYFNGINPDSIITVTDSGAFSLTPVTTASNMDPIAIKILTGRANEYFMAEYRNPDVSGDYDADIPGTGLIIYRINTQAKEGNLYAKYKDSNNPDEVYIFRPSVATGATYAKSRLDLNYAALSPNNQYFNSIGKFTGASSYDYNSLHFSDGTNSGIIIEAVSIDAESIDFIVKFSKDYSIDSNYFNNKIQLDQASLVNNTYSGVLVDMWVDDIALQNILSISIELRTQSNNLIATNTLKRLQFVNTYNQGDRNFVSPFIINNKGQLVFSVFSHGLIDKSQTPKIVVLKVLGADKSLHEYRIPIDANSIDWTDILNTALDSNPSVYAGPRLSAGIRIDGSIVITTSLTSGQWAIIDPLYTASKIAAGLTHTLVLRNDLTVFAAGSDTYYELNTSGWSEIIDIAAGQYTSYGLKSDGTVVSTGLNNKGQISVSNWTDIIAIAAGSQHVVGLKKDGTVVTSGEAGEKLNTSSWSDIVTVVAGTTFTAALNSSGRVFIAGSIVGADNVKSWSGIQKIIAGTDFLYGLTSDGTVLSLGSNSYGQCDTQELADIISMAAGERHGIFLRSDGEVFFTGSNNPSYPIITPMPNLIYDEYISAQAITLTLESNLVEVGTRVTTEVTFNPENSTYKAIQYSSSDETIATIDKYGKITAKGLGVAIITARSIQSGVYDSKPIEVAVLTPPSSISFNSTSHAVIVGESINLGFTVFPTGARLNPDYFTWIVSNDTICEVSNTGVLAAKSIPGIVQVTLNYIDPLLNIIISTWCTVAVSDEITAVQWENLPSKLIYRYGEVLDLSDGSIKITTLYGDIVNILTDLPALLITGFDSSVLSTNSEVTISYFGFSLFFNVSIVDYAKSVGFKILPKSEFLYGDEFSIGSSYIRWDLASGATLDKALSMSDVSGYNKYSIGLATLKVSVYYNNDLFELYYDIIICDFVTSIDANIIDITYEFWDDFKHMGMFYARMSSGNIKNIPLTDGVLTGFNNTKIGYQTVTISYTDPATLNVFEDFREIYIKTPNASLQISGEDETGTYRYLLNATTPYITITALINGVKVELKNYETNGIWYELNNFQSSSSDTYFDVVLYVLKNTTDIYEELAIVTDLYARIIQEFDGILTGNKYQYKFGEVIDIQLEITPLNSIYPSYKITPTTDMISYQPTLIGVEQTYTVCYIGEEFSTIIIINNYMTDVFVESDSTVIYGDSLDITFWAAMAYGDNLNITDDIKYTLDTAYLGLGSHSVAYSYIGSVLGFTGEHYIEITIIDAEESIGLLESLPDQISFPYGSSFDPTISFLIYMRSGATKTIAYTQEYFTTRPSYNPYTLVNQSIVLTYTPLKIVFPAITFVAKNFVASLSVDSVSQSEYKYGAALLIFITATYADETTAPLPLKTPSVAGYTTNYNPSKIGSQTVTISYIDPVRENITLTVNFNVTVINSATSLVITKIPTTSVYNYGEALSFSGGEVEVSFLNGDKSTYSGQNVLTNVSVSFNCLIAGIQEVVLTKSGKSASFLVTVSSLDHESTLVSSSSGNASFNYTTKSVTIVNSFSYAAIKAILTNPLYLDLVFKSSTGTVITTSNMVSTITSASRLCIVNKSGTVVREYTIWLAGDANLDGVFDIDDLNYLANQYLSKNGQTEITDYDYDGTFSLTDLINWAKKSRAKDTTNETQSVNYILPNELLKRKENYIEK
ncbi:MAG: M6 family metalloprotease domain-containing protein [Christensenellaceae bacterium]|jgi:M6 family metalloprotease-like protein|nr:M6 family metalloprotease domain-containing protein [Christensenellaceae bacterium]